MKNSLMSANVEYQMFHSAKFLIDIDNESSESSDSQISSETSNVDNDQFNTGSHKHNS